MLCFNPVFSGIMWFTNFKVGTARCAVPVAERSARRARARRGRSGDGKMTPYHICSVLSDGDAAARRPYHPKSLSKT